MLQAIAHVTDIYLVLILPTYPIYKDPIKQELRKQITVNQLQKWGLVTGQMRTLEA